MTYHFHNPIVNWWIRQVNIYMELYMYTYRYAYQDPWHQVASLGHNELSYIKELPLIIMYLCVLMYQALLKLGYEHFRLMFYLAYWCSNQIRLVSCFALLLGAQ